jgi:hypothetical protein
MMNKSLRGAGRESSRNRFYGFRRGEEEGQKRQAPRPKKEPPNESAAFEVDNREASNRVDRSHSVSKRGRVQS